MYALTRFNDHDFWGPFRELDQLTRGFWGSDTASNSFKMDVADQGDAYELSADMPGMNKEDIHLDLDNDTLTISAERHSEYEDKKDGGYVRIERSYGSFSRSFDVSEIETNQITAKYENGVLKLWMPKKQAAVPTSRRLEIQ